MAVINAGGVPQTYGYVIKIYHNIIKSCGDTYLMGC